MNHIIIAGRLGKDAETRFTPDGAKVTSFNVATNARRGGKDETTWWRVSMWGDRWDNMVPYLKKGSAIIVSGEVRAGAYTDKNGQPQPSLDIRAETVRFSPFGKPDQQGNATGGNNAQQEETSVGQAAAPSDMSPDQDDDPLPF